MDPRDPSSFTHRFAPATVDGVKLHFVDEGSSTSPIVVLVHGFPDYWYGWRFQIGALVRAGYRVIVPDLRGYGQSEGPRVTSFEDPALRSYGFKNLCRDVLDIVDHATSRSDTRFVVVGHDWGGMVAWRLCMHSPARIIAVAAVCTAYVPPSPTYISVDEIVKLLPNFKYQKWFSEFETDALLDQRTESVFRRIWVSRKSAESGQSFVTLSKENLHYIPVDPSGVPMSDVLSHEELQHYVNTYKATGFHGPLNLYRTRRVNYEDEIGLPSIVSHKALMVVANYDLALPPSMARKMSKFVPNVTFKYVDAGHWVPSEQSAQLNGMLKEWLKDAFAEPASGGSSKL
ncbi:Alpha/Beta hydrolase protein [Zopfochytrium polystomum]|nr:Alpha/Beta hydrolase protein [Zopfochytrium polystomum]